MRKVVCRLLKPWLGWSLVLLGLVLGGWWSFNVVAAQDIGIGGIGGRPAYPRSDNARSESIFIHTLEPGTQVTEGVNVINNTELRRTISVYATDSINSSDGAFACAQKVEDKTDVGSWISLSKSSVTLDPNSTEIVPFTITVPTSVDIGEHNGCIVIQGEDAPTVTESGIGLSFRTAIRVAILIPGEIVKELEITGFSVSIDQGQVIMSPQITNSGNVSVDVDILTTLKTLNGLVVSDAGGRFPALRDQIGEWNFEHQKPFWGGWYRAEVVASYDANPENFLGSSNPDIRILHYPSDIVFLMPRVVALIIEIMALALLSSGIGLIIRAILHRRDVSRRWIDYHVSSTDNIKSVAKKRGISWRRLARANHLKAPYALEKGQIIKVPDKTPHKI